MTTILIQNNSKVNDLNALMDLTSRSTKINLCDAHNRQSARFITPDGIKPVEIEAATYEQFVRQLKRAGWNLVPGLSNGSYTARKQAQRQPSLAGQAALLILILAWLVLATFGRSPVVAAAPTAMKRESRIEMVSGEVLKGRSILVNLGESVWVLEV